MPSSHRATLSRPSRRPRLRIAAALAVAGALLAAPAADAAPRRSVVTTQTGKLVMNTRTPCVPQLVQVPLDPGTRVERLHPATGDLLTEEGIAAPADAQGRTAAWRVTAAAVVGGTATWAIEPIQPGCDELRGAGGYGWYFEALWNTRRYRAHIGQSGTTMLAGLRLSRMRISSYPQVRRALGRPSKLVVRPTKCTADWRRIGLRIDFRNFGGGTGRGCRDGHPLVATITRPDLWAVTSSSAPAVLGNTPIQELEDSQRARKERGRNAWSFGPMHDDVTGGAAYGASGFAAGRDSPFRRFDVWIGHAGE